MPQVPERPPPHQPARSTASALVSGNTGRPDAGLDAPAGSSESAESSKDASERQNGRTQTPMAGEHGARTPTRPLPFLHPTRAEFAPLPTAKEHLLGRAVEPSARWSSRASRKNRYARRPLRVVPRRAQEFAESAHGGREAISAAGRDVAVIEQRMRHPASRIKVHLAWDLAFWVALVFVLGSTLWVSRLPSTSPEAQAVS